MASRNDGVACNLDGASSNNFTVGIEHAGYASQSAWSDGLIQASAKLTCNITKNQSIPRDKWHIVGHGQLQPYNRVDPGPNWPWAQYIDLVDSYCTTGSPTAPPDPMPDLLSPYEHIRAHLTESGLGVEGYSLPGQSSAPGWAPGAQEHLRRAHVGPRDVETAV